MYSQADLLAVSLADYLGRHPGMLGAEAQGIPDHRDPRQGPDGATRFSATTDRFRGRWSPRFDLSAFAAGA